MKEVSFEEFFDIAKKDCPELRDLAREIGFDPASTSLHLWFQRVDTHFLNGKPQESFRSESRFGDERKAEYTLYAHCNLLFLDSRPPFLATEKRLVSADIGPSLSIRRCLYKMFRNWTALRHINRLFLVRIVRGPSELPERVHIQVWKPKRGVNLKKELQALAREERQALKVDLGLEH